MLIKKQCKKIILLDILDQKGNIAIFFLFKEVKESNLDFSQGVMRALRAHFTKLIYLYEISMCFD